MRDLFKADAYPASNAAFHCLYFSPNLTTTMSAFSIAFLVLIALNLAAALSKAGHKTGLLDLDIYGPSLPKLFDIGDKPESDGQKLIPIIKYGQNNNSMKFNHQALLVNDLNQSGYFYYNILGFEEIEVGAGQNPPKRWFKSDDGMEIHLISTKEKLKSIPKGVHMAFSVKNFDLFINNLKAFMVLTNRFRLLGEISPNVNESSPNLTGERMREFF